MSVKSARLRRVSSADIELTESLHKNWLFNFKIKRPFYFNPKHREFYNCIKSPKTKMGFVDGPAGSMKTYIAVYAGLELIKQEEFQRMVYIRSVTESAERSLGSLPGEIDDKFSPYAIPLEEKVTEITDSGTYSMLKQKGVVEAIPVNFVRGLTFNNSLVIVDEAQNLSRKELTTILTRFGRNSKYIVIGDSNQADVNKSGYREIFNMFNTKQCKDNDIYSFEFGNSEIARSKILRFICSVLGT
jgi:phosphate starvation-inducible PhoH-like protein|tara:strand:- start:300 stop:1031 length:732 start_codon:yes stop_codon:yes gene_type:complete